MKINITVKFYQLTADFMSQFNTPPHTHTLLLGTQTIFALLKVIKVVYTGDGCNLLSIYCYNWFADNHKISAHPSPLHAYTSGTMGDITTKSSERLEDNSRISQVTIMIFERVVGL